MKTILTSFLIILNVVALSQSPTDNLKKYWYYRYRLINDFMKVGPSRGESIPAGHRIGPRYGTGKLHWGDATIKLGEYIGVLATEYKLLKDNNQNLEQTKMELYYALEAFNRLDEHAESYFRCVTCPPNPQSGDLNGFFIRDDVTLKDDDIVPKHKDFVDENKDHFNSNPGALVDVTGVIESSFDKVYEIPPNSPTRVPPTAGSHDQVWDIMMGCALVAKLVDPIDTYNNQQFRDTETRFVQEAKNIVDRLITWMNKDGDWAIKYPDNVFAVAGECMLGITGDCLGDQSQITYSTTTGWNGVTGSWNPGNCAHDFDCGTGSWLLSWGAAEAAEKITGNNYSHWHLGVFKYKGLWEIYQKLEFPAGVFDNLSDEFTKIMTLAAIGHSWHHTVINPGCIVLTYKGLILLAIDLATPLPTGCVITSPTNNTGTQLSQVASITGKQIYPLLHQTLHGGINPFITNNFYTNLMDEAPCEGPYNFGNGDYPNFEWSSVHRWRTPEGRGHNSPNQRGENVGLDYMLLHNLYYIVKGEDFPAYVNLMNVDVDTDFPHIVLGIPIGSKVVPKTIGAFRSITADNTINAGGTPFSDGDVTYRAGKEITLKPGFEVKAGAEFHAYIDPFVCVGEDYQKTGDSTGNQYGMPDPLPQPNNFVPLVYEEETTAYEEEETTETLPIEASISIHPNPSSGEFTIQLTGDAGQGTSEVYIYDIFGRLIYNQHIASSSNQHINISQHPKGIYLVKVIQGEEVFIERIIHQ